MTARSIAFKAARRLVPVMPSSVQALAASLAARSVDGPARLPGPPPGPVLCLAPHPDDETIGCGGTLALHAARGDEIRVVVVTSGEASAAGGAQLGARREAEAAAACGILGVGEPELWGLPDGAVADHVNALARRIAAAAVGCAAVYAPSVLDPHRDHLAVNAALARAGADVDVYGYEVWSPVPITAVVDISESIDVKRRALAAYEAALETVDYVRSSDGLAAYRSASGGMGGRGWAEGFCVLTAAEHAEAMAART